MKRLCLWAGWWIMLLCLQHTGVLHAENARPFVIPALQEWQGGEGYWQSSRRIVLDDCCAAELNSAARVFAADLQEMFGEKFQIVKGKTLRHGDIFMTLQPLLAADNPEKYELDIAQHVVLKGGTPQAVFWGTRTLLQMMEQHAAQLPQGKAVDWPNYPKRGFMLDVGRKFVPVSFLRDYVKIMSYYKMNCFQIHLNDNGFKKFYDNDWSKTPAGFRLESTVFPGLATEGAHYTKKEFIELQKLAEGYQVNIIPEIDVPAHSLALTRYKPEIASKEYGEDHLDLFNPETYRFVDALLAEYLEGEEPVFRGKEVHIGTDEYSNADPKVVEKFRYFTDYYIRYVESFGKKAVAWGALTHAKGSQPVKSEDVLLDIWYNGYADPVEMAGLGFDLLNVSCSQLYIIPLTALYYHDYLNIEWLYNTWEPFMFDDKVFAADDKRIKGGMFAVWNDYIGNGITYKDIHHRAYPAVQTLGQKMWSGKAKEVDFATFDAGRKKLSEAPGVNIGGRIYSTQELVLYVEKLRRRQSLPLAEIGFGYRVAFDFLATSAEKGLVLFQSPHAKVYQTSPETGKLAFYMDGYLNEFDYTLPLGKKVHLEITGDPISTHLYVDGQLHQSLDKRVQKQLGQEKVYYQSTLMFPLAKTGDFKGRLTNLTVRQAVEGSAFRQPQITLSNYLIEPQVKGACVGRILTPRQTDVVRIVQDTAQLFRMEGHQLLLRKNRWCIPSSGVQTYGITLQIGEELKEVELLVDEFADNRVIAHRGAWKHTATDQNTLASFQKAVELRCHGSEFDVWLTADNQIVLSHDPVLCGIDIEKSTLSQLRALTLPRGGKVATLEELIQQAKQQKHTKMILEIKPSMQDAARSIELAERVLAVVHRLKAQAWMEYISFDYGVLRRIHQLDAAAKTQYLGGDKSVEEVSRDGLTGIDYSFYCFRQDAKLIEKAHQTGLTVNVWTVNQPKDLKDFFHSAVDYITTDEPERLLEYHSVVE